MSSRSLFRCFLMVMLLLLVACGGEDTSLSSKPSLRILALGDSYTIGEGVGRSERWPFQLVAALSSDSLTVVQPTVVAATGWTTSDLLQAIAQAALDPPYDIVTLLIGVNDQFQGYSVEAYTTGFETLLERAISFARSDPTRVIILSIPDYTLTPFGRVNSPANSAKALSRLNTSNRENATNRGVTYVDITPISRLVSGDPELIALDDLHPSGKMYSLWVRELPPVVRPILRGSI